jgi:hypothetical protein
MTMMTIISRSLLSVCIFFVKGDWLDLFDGNKDAAWKSGSREEDVHDSSNSNTFASSIIHLLRGTHRNDMH